MNAEPDLLGSPQPKRANDRDISRDLNVILSVLLLEFCVDFNWYATLTSAPAILNGLTFNPLASSGIEYYLWISLAYWLGISISALIFSDKVDTLDPVRIYKLGSCVFTACCALLFFTPGRGSQGALEVIVVRLIQGMAAGLLVMTSLGILLTAFPPRRIGLTVLLFSIVSTVGLLSGPILGSILAITNWHLIFLFSIPFAAAGSILGLMALRASSSVNWRDKLEWAPSLTAAIGVTVMLIGITGLMEPVERSVWYGINLLAIAEVVAGSLLLALFVWSGSHWSATALMLSLFKIRSFIAGNIRTLLSVFSTQWVEVVVIVWLEGIWLPLHGFTFQDALVWSGIYLSPLLLGSAVIWWFTSAVSSWTRGLLLVLPLGWLLIAEGLMGLAFLPSTANYLELGTLLLLIGAGEGMLGQANFVAMYGSVPRERFGVASSVGVAVQSIVRVLSVGTMFVIVTIGLSATLAPALHNGLTSAGLPAAATDRIARLPAGVVLLCVMLGVNPLRVLVSPMDLQRAPAGRQADLLSGHLFPGLIQSPMDSSLHVAFCLSLVICIAGAVGVTLLRGRDRGVNQ